MKSHLEYWHPESWVELSGRQKEMASASLNRHFWKWYEQHKDDVILRVLFWTKRVSDIKWLFIKLFGEPKTS